MARRSALGEPEGLVKTVFDAATGELLGAHMVGAEVTELIQGYAVAKTLEGTERDLMATVFPHPTISETMHESVLDAWGRRFMSSGATLDNRTSPRPRRRKPDWIRVRAPVSPGYAETRRLMRRLALNTVCEEAACPNIGECWAGGHATVMILGSVCTRKCAFCNVATGRPDLLDPHEPDRLADAIAELGLRHVVVTSVDRDDLSDGGAAHFVRCIERIRDTAPETTSKCSPPTSSVNTAQ